MKGFGQKECVEGKKGRQKIMYGEYGGGASKPFLWDSGGPLPPLICEMFLCWYLLLQIVKLTVELPLLVKWQNSSAFKLWKTCQVEGKINHQIEMRSTVPVLSKSFQLDATRLSFSIFCFGNLSLFLLQHDQHLLSSLKRTKDPSVI